MIWASCNTLSFPCSMVLASHPIPCSTFFCNDPPSCHAGSKSPHQGSSSPNCIRQNVILGIPTLAQRNLMALSKFHNKTFPGLLNNGRKRLIQECSIILNALAPLKVSTHQDCKCRLQLNHEVEQFFDKECNMHLFRTACPTQPPTSHPYFHFQKNKHRYKSNYEPKSAECLHCRAACNTHIPFPECPH